MSHPRFRNDFPVVSLSDVESDCRGLSHVSFKDVAELLCTWELLWLVQY